MKQTYPVILTPSTEKFLPWQLSQGKSRKVGASEIVDMSRILRLGIHNLQEDLQVRIEGHSYEPDFAFVDKSKGVFIDIEIDEPYSSNGKPTHYLLENGSNKDSDRNRRFQEAGWYVCRFSEKQFFCQTASCLKIIFRILVSKGILQELPEKLQNAPDLLPDERWTIEQSRIYKQQVYRKSYLGFDPGNMDWPSLLYCIKVALPMFHESIYEPKLRKRFSKQLFRYFIK